MRKIDIPQLLNAVLFPLLIALASPHAVSHSYTQDTLYSGSTQSIIGVNITDPGCLDEDKPELNRAPEWVGEHPQRISFTRCAGSLREPGIAFTVSQARAPPLR